MGFTWDAGSPSAAIAARRQNSSRHERQKAWRHGTVCVAASSTSVQIYSGRDGEVIRKEVAG